MSKTPFHFPFLMALFIWHSLTSRKSCLRGKGGEKRSEKLLRPREGAGRGLVQESQDGAQGGNGRRRPESSADWKVSAHEPLAVVGAASMFPLHYYQTLPCLYVASFTIPPQRSWEVCFSRKMSYSPAFREKFVMNCLFFFFFWLVLV